MLRKNVKSCFIVIFVLLMILVSNNSNAKTNNYQSNYGYIYDYVINNYNIDMTVNEDNSFDVIENIIVYFNVPKHGIYRKIPVKNEIIRLDGTKSSNNAKIRNIKVNANYTISNESGYNIIKIGDANRTLTGAQTYTIKYNYNIGKDPIKDADELYFNLIGDKWDTSISNVSFKITMPKSFDKSLLGFSSGNVGSTNSSNVTYSVDGNVITGNTINTLYPGQALTVRLTLPEGYFVDDSSKLDIFSIFVIILCAIFVLIADRLWLKYGKDDKVIDTVEFYPPEGCNSADVGFLYKGSVDTKAIISLIVYLANKGYLCIEENQEIELFLRSKGFRITKLKEYDGSNEIERIFFKGLFANSEHKNIDMKKIRKVIKESKERGEKIGFQEAIDIIKQSDEISKQSVTAKDLYNNFYTTLNRIKSKMNSKENKNKIFESSAGGKRKYLILMMIVIFVLITIKPLMEYSEDVAILMPPIMSILPRNKLNVISMYYC